MPISRLLIFLSCFLFPFHLRAANILIPDCPTQLTYHQGTVCKKAGWILIHVEGSPFERGEQQGYLLSGPIANYLRNIKFYLTDNHHKTWPFWIKQSMKYFAPHLDKELLAEMKGMAAGSVKAGKPLTWQDVLTINASHELNDYWFPKFKWLQKRHHRGHCTAIVATGNATPDHKVIMAHDSVDNYIVGQYQNIILDEVPSTGHRFMMQTMPAYLISDADLFITNAGIMGTETTIEKMKTQNYNFSATPGFIRIRHAMQYANSLEDWVKIASKGNNGGLAESWLLADMNTQRIMIFDCAYPHTFVESKNDGYYYVHNNPYNAKIGDEDTSWTRADYHDLRNHIGSRGARLKKLVHKYDGKLTIPIMQKIFSDIYDPYLKRDRLGYRSIEAHGEFENGADFPKNDQYRPYEPLGSLDAIIMTSTMAKQWSFWARWGNASGRSFDANNFFTQHKSWQKQKAYLSTVPREPWILVKAASR